MAAWQSRRARAWRNCTAPADLNASCGIVLLNAVPASSSLLTGSLLVFSQNSPDCSGNQATIVIGEYVKADTCSRRTRDARNVTGTVWCFSGTKIICRRDALRAYRERRLNDYPASELDDLQPVRSGVAIAYLSHHQSLGTTLN